MKIYLKLILGVIAVSCSTGLFSDENKPMDGLIRIGDLIWDIKNNRSGLEWDAATFNYPVGVAFDTNGNLFVADRLNNKIRKITPDGNVTTLAGNGAVGSTDGIRTSASFYYPFGIAISPDGYIYVADSGNNKIRRISP